MSFTVKRRQTKKPLLKTPNKRLFRNFNIKGLKTRPILLTDAKGPRDKRPTRFIEPSMGPRSNIRLVFDGQAVQDEGDGVKALPELYRSLMEEKAAAEGIPLKDKLDRERAREEVKQQNRDEIEQYKLSKHYLDRIAEIQRREEQERQQADDEQRRADEAKELFDVIPDEPDDTPDLNNSMPQEIVDRMNRITELESDIRNLKRNIKDRIDLGVLDEEHTSVGVMRRQKKECEAEIKDLKAEIKILEKEMRDNAINGVDIDAPNKKSDDYIEGLFDNLDDITAAIDKIDKDIIVSNRPNVLIKRKKLLEKNQSDVVNHIRSLHPINKQYIEYILNERSDLMPLFQQIPVKDEQKGDDGLEKKDDGSDDDDDDDSMVGPGGTVLAPTVVGDQQAQQQILSNDPLNQFLEEGGGGDLNELKIKMQSRKNTIHIMEEYLNDNGVQLPPKKTKKADYIDLVISHIKAQRMNNAISLSEGAAAAADREQMPELSSAAAAASPQAGNGRHRHHHRNPITHVIHLKNTLHGRGRVSALSLL